MSNLPHGEIKRRVYEALPEAYAEASAGGRLPAPARQVGYAVRRLSGLGDELTLDYFLKRLLDSCSSKPPFSRCRIAPKRRSRPPACRSRARPAPSRPGGAAAARSARRGAP